MFQFRQSFSFTLLQVTLPSILSFASDETIPLTLSVVSPQAPAVTKLLMPSIRIQLVKRTRLWINNGKMGSKHDAAIGNADVLNVDESHEGVSTLVCELRSALSSTIASWSITDVAEQQVRSVSYTGSLLLKATYKTIFSSISYVC